MANDFSGDSSVQALYRFESGALTTDSSGKNNTLTAEGSPAESATAKEGSRSVEYNGSSVCHYRQDTDLTADFPTKNGDTTKVLSFCLWFMADSIPGAGVTRSLIAKWKQGWGGDFSWVLRLGESKLNFEWGYAASSTETFELYASPATGRWYHVGIALDGVNKTLLYRVWDDTAGAVVASGTETPTNVLRVSGVQFTIGAEYNQINHASYYDGKIDEVVIFDRLLDAGTIDDIRAGNFPLLAIETLSQASAIDDISVVRSESDGISSGGLVVGGTDASGEARIVVDPPCSGGLVVGGTDAAQWSNPLSVAVKGGTYRISGTTYTLANTLYYEGLGDIAAIVDVDTAPATAGLFRYDVLVIGIDEAIHVVAGTEAATPVLPSTTASHVKINHILRYYGQTRIEQSDIGRNYTAPTPTSVGVSASDDELAWGETTSTLTVNIYNQYGALYRSSVTINAAFLVGNGTLAPMAASTATGTATFLYTRDGADPGDVSPILEFSTSTGAAGVVPITLLDAAGDVMT